MDKKAWVKEPFRAELPKMNEEEVRQWLDVVGVGSSQFPHRDDGWQGLYAFACKVFRELYCSSGADRRKQAVERAECVLRILEVSTEDPDFAVVVEKWSGLSKRTKRAVTALIRGMERDAS